MYFECLLKDRSAEVVFHDQSEKYFFDRESIQRLTEIIIDLKKKVGQIKLKSSNPTIFSLGFDPEQFNFDVKSFDDIRYGLGLGQKLIREIFESKVQFTCEIKGLCIGAGLEFALACENISLASNAKMKFPEFEIGLFPSYGGFYLMAKKFSRSIAIEHMKKCTYLRKSQIQNRPSEIKDQILDADVEKIINALNLREAQELSTELFLKKVKVKYNR